MAATSLSFRPSNNNGAVDIPRRQGGSRLPAPRLAIGMGARSRYWMAGRNVLRRKCAFRAANS